MPVAELDEPPKVPRSVAVFPFHRVACDEESPVNPTICPELLIALAELIDPPRVSSVVNV